MLRPRLVTKVNRLPSVQANLPRKRREAQMQAAERIAAKEREIVPVDTGRLKASIRVVSEDNRVLVIAGTHEVYWGIFNEYGTINMRAQPFVRPAIEGMGIVVERSAGNWSLELIA